MDPVSQSAIFGPVFATVFLTFAVWVLMFVRRVPFITGQQLTQEQLATPGELARLSPASVSNPSDNFKNLFEVPVVFYVLAFYLFVTGQVDGVYLAAAWVFAGFRVLHSLVHCSINIVMLRFYMYLASALAVWFIAGRAFLGFIGA